MRHHRRLHRQEAEHLQHVVLDDVADRAGLFVELAAALHVEALGHRDLHALDVVAIPDRLEKRVREPEDTAGSGPAPCRGSGRSGRCRTRRRPLCSVAFKRLRRREVAAERLLEDDARAARAARLGQRADDQREQARRNGEVVQRMLGTTELGAQTIEGVDVLVVAVDVAQQLRPAWRMRPGPRRRRAARGCRAPVDAASRDCCRGRRR